MQRAKSPAEMFTQLRVRPRLAIIAIHVLQQGGQLGECALVNAAVLGNALACAYSKLVKSPPRFRHADNRYVESVSFDQSLKRWKDLFVRKIPNCTEENNRIRM